LITRRKVYHTWLIRSPIAFGILAEAYRNASWKAQDSICQDCENHAVPGQIESVPKEILRTKSPSRQKILQQNAAHFKHFVPKRSSDETKNRYKAFNLWKSIQ
jgi:hypothetical protein